MAASAASKPVQQVRQTIQNSIQLHESHDLLHSFAAINNAAEKAAFYEQARQISEDVISSRAGSDDAFYAQKTQLFLQIAQHDENAEQTLQQWRKAFSRHPDFIVSLREVADIYIYYGQDAEKAGRLYGDILKTWPAHSEAVWARRGQVMAAIKSRDLADADAGVESLLTEYEDHPQINSAVRIVADQYFYADESERARPLYEWILQHGSDCEAIWAQRGLVACYLRMGDYPAADAALNGLQQGFSDHPGYDAAIRAVADEYFYYGHNPSVAEELYKQILQQFPASEEAIWAQRGLVLTSLASGDDAAADEAVETLLLAYDEHPQIATAVRIVADQFFYARQDYKQAGALYERIIQKWPDSGERMAAQRGLAMVNIRTNPDTASQTAGEMLLKNFPHRRELSENSGEIIDQYCRAGKSTEAVAFCKKILAGHPDHAMQLAGHTGLARAYIQMNHDHQAVEQITAVVTNYRDQDRIGYSVFVIGEEYYNRGLKALNAGDTTADNTDFRKALALWQTNINAVSDPRHRCLAYYFSGLAWSHLGNDTEAAVHWEKVVDEYPAFERRWDALYRLAEGYQKRALAKEITQAQSDQKVQAIYTDLMDNYPDCPVVQTARRWLNEYRHRMNEQAAAAARNQS